MGVNLKEIEKKYLITLSPEVLESRKKQSFKKESIWQSYISYDPEMRIRRICSSCCVSIHTKHDLTFKSDGGLERDEITVTLTRLQYEQFYTHIKHHEIEKERYHIQLDDDLVAELNIYRGRLENLVTVEVEFRCCERASQFSPPYWFGKDVTDCKRYKNKELSKTVLPFE